MSELILVGFFCFLGGAFVFGLIPEWLASGRRSTAEAVRLNTEKSLKRNRKRSRSEIAEMLSEALRQIGSSHDHIISHLVAKPDLED
jgi:hypothetical protein